MDKVKMFKPNKVTSSCLLSQLLRRRHHHSALSRPPTMDDPPPYSASDPVVLLSRIAEFIDHHDYPQLCLVSSMWRDVFQARLWAQPHRYFTTQNRSTSG